MSLGLLLSVRNHFITLESERDEILPQHPSKLFSIQIVIDLSNRAYEKPPKGSFRARSMSMIWFLQTALSQKGKPGIRFVNHLLICNQKNRGSHNPMPRKITSCKHRGTSNIYSLTQIVSTSFLFLD
jgi:hypothetical protein